MHLISLAEVIEQGGTDIDDLLGKKRGRSTEITNCLTDISPDHDLPSEINEFLSAFENPHGVKSLKDLVDFNEKHASLELPAGRLIKLRFYETS